MALGRGAQLDGSANTPENLEAGNDTGRAERR
jgi:hypothetical protein